MSAKMATPGLLNIMVFWKKLYDVIIPIDGVTNNILSRDSNYIVDVFMWPQFGKSSISMSEVVTTSILRSGLGSSSRIWHWHQVQTWHFAPVRQKA